MTDDEIQRARGRGAVGKALAPRLCHGFEPCPRPYVLYNTIITLYYTLFALILGLLVLRKEDKGPWRRALID